MGVGFLGAGTMMHQQKHVIGLTTASSIWLVAAIGMAAGVGMVGLAASVTVMALVCLTLFAPFSSWLEHRGARHARKKGIPVVHEEPRVHFVSYQGKHPAKRRRKGVLDEATGKD